MRPIVAAALSGVLVCAGCTQWFLPVATVTESFSLADLKTKLVLENLGKFAHDPDAIPSDVDVKSGIVQATTSVGASLTLPYQHIGTAAKSATVGPNSFNSQDNWTITAVTDPDDLQRLRCLYGYAINPRKMSFANYRNRICPVPYLSMKDPANRWKTAPISALPPQHYWLNWRTGNALSENAKIESARGGNCGTFEGTDLCWSSNKDLSDFVLAVSAAIPNTTGVNVAAVIPSTVKIYGPVPPCTVHPAACPPPAGLHSEDSEAPQGGPQPPITLQGPSTIVPMRIPGKSDGVVSPGISPPPN